MLSKEKLRVDLLLLPNDNGCDCTHCFHVVLHHRTSGSIIHVIRSKAVRDHFLQESCSVVSPFKYPAVHTHLWKEPYCSAADGLSLTTV